VPTGCLLERTKREEHLLENLLPSIIEADRSFPVDADSGATSASSSWGVGIATVVMTAEENAAESAKDKRAPTAPK
jgi:hypothetical protein